jgi:hypothetical protein
MYIHDEHRDGDIVGDERRDIPVSFEEHLPVRKDNDYNSPADSTYRQRRQAYIEETTYNKAHQAANGWKRLEYGSCDGLMPCAYIDRMCQMLLIGSESIDTCLETGTETDEGDADPHPVEHTSDRTHIREPGEDLGRTAGDTHVRQETKLIVFVSESPA